MSKFCIKCGAELEDTNMFCDECGTKQPVEQITEQQPKTSAVPKTTPLTQNAIPQYQNIENSNSVVLKKSKLGIASLILGIISICTFGAFVIPEIVGIVLGAIALADKKTGNGFPLAGLILSIIGLIILILIIIIA